jgi:hypothetical protein
VWLSYEDYGDPDAGAFVNVCGFLRKYNKSGKVVWTRKIIGTPNPDLIENADAPEDVAVDGNGNVYVVGSTNGSLSGTNGGFYDMFIRKYSASGRVLWTRQRHYSDYDFANNVAVSDSSVYLIGEFVKGNDFDTGPKVRVIKHNTDGSMIWDKGYRTYETSLQVSDASADRKGNLYVSGTGSDRNNQSSNYRSVIKLNPNGGYTWKKLFDTFMPNAVLSRTDAQVYVGGLGLIRLRGSDGSTVWTNQ